VIEGIAATGAKKAAPKKAVVEAEVTDVAVEAPKVKKAPKAKKEDTQD
jgi:large subunit ribosomal protein L21